MLNIQAQGITFLSVSPSLKKKTHEFLSTQHLRKTLQKSGAIFLLEQRIFIPMFFIKGFFLVFTI